MITLAAATFARSEYSSFRPLLKALAAHNDVNLRIWAGGMHLDPRFGETVREIERDGFTVAARLPVPLERDDAGSWVRGFAGELTAAAQLLETAPPDLLLMVGDRAELLPLATAALLFRVPIAHFSGGDLTEGAIDNQVRFAVSRLSHLHFVSMQEHAERLLRSGEEPWRVHVTGDPALDALADLNLFTRAELERDLGLSLESPVIVLTYHPTSLSDTGVAAEIDEVAAALEAQPGALIITGSNADIGFSAILDRLRALERARPRTVFVANLGQRRYYSLLALADVMVGNSSSAIWEAPSFALPAVNIGDRQKGRTRAGNVVDVETNRGAIAAGIRNALDPAFRARLRGVTNPYGDGAAVPRIVQALLNAPPAKQLLTKRYVEGVSR